jgi:hypothetical protein
MTKVWGGKLREASLNTPIENQAGAGIVHTVNLLGSILPLAAGSSTSVLHSIGEIGIADNIGGVNFLTVRQNARYLLSFIRIYQQLCC